MDFVILYSAVKHRDILDARCVLDVKIDASENAPRKEKLHDRGAALDHSLLSC